MTMKTDRTDTEISVDTGSTVTFLILKKLKDWKLSPMTKKYQDINKN